jgi:hypothetical protein
MQITLVPDSSISSAPAGFTAAVEAAASVFEQDFPGDYNVNISYGWGTYDNAPSADLTTPDLTFSLGGGSYTFVSYPELKDLLTANATSSAQIAALESLPASDASFPGGADTFLVSFAEEKALGIFGPDTGEIDGSIGFNIADTDQPEFWEAAALTEIIHALGWDTIAQGQESTPSVADLFRYSSPGEYEWSSGQPAYFSIDGGNTRLGDFSTSFDQTLFTDLPAGDALELPITIPETALTSFDIEALSVIGFGVANVAPPPARHFIAAGNSPDILWQNTTSGQASVWDMSGTRVSGGGAISPNPGPSWAEVGTGDFNDDGHSDILWQKANGQVSVWEMNGNTLIGGGAVGANPGPDWTVIGTGDFNDDGHSDILWQNTSTGQVSIWEMNGTNIVGGGPLSSNPGPAWKAVGTGDFNDDGHSDILWQNTSTGQLSVWEMNGTNVVGGGPVNFNPGPSSQPLGTGDFNDDGHSDILLRNADTGQVSILEMNGTSVIGGGPVAPNPGLGWIPVETGDFNGDGHSDILWQNTSTGQASIWEMNGANVIGGGPVSPNPGASWRAA